MDAKELRIGNYIADRGLKEWQIDHWETMNKVSAKPNTTMCNGVLMETHPLTEYVDYLKPIPLTEEWLVRFGFDRGRIKFGNAEELELDKDNGHYNIFYNQYNNDATREKILMHLELMYVHQLQNLYFALTGEELTIK